MSRGIAILKNRQRCIHRTAFERDQRRVFEKATTMCSYTATLVHAILSVERLSLQLHTSIRVQLFTVQSNKFEIRVINNHADVCRRPPKFSAAHIPCLTTLPAKHEKPTLAPNIFTPPYPAMPSPRDKIDHT